MSRIAFAVFSILCLLPSTAYSQADKRVEDALAEIALLKRIVAEQDRRITDLERTVKALQGSRDQTPPSPQTLIPPSPAGAWKSAVVWTLIKEGMSRAQVIARLGKPTSVKSIGTFETLFYQGDVPGSGSVTGTIELNDDRVWQINIPVF